MPELNFRQLAVEAANSLLHFGALFGAEQFHAVGAGLELVELPFGFACLLKNPARNIAVDFAAGQFFQQLCTLVGAGVEECRKAALGKQHGFGKAREIEAGDLGDALQLVIALRAEDGAIAIGEFDLGGLQCAIGLVTRTALAPESTVDGTFDFELDLGQTVGGVPRHDVVVRGRDGLQARRLVVKREADGVEQCRFASAGRAGDGEQAVVGERRLGEVDGPFALQ